MRIASFSKFIGAQETGGAFSKSQMIMIAQAIPQRQSLTSISVMDMSGALMVAQAMSPMRGGGMMSDPWMYKCDPEKNNDCKKTCCQSCCFLTTHKEFSKDGKRYRFVQGELMEVKEDEI